MPRSERTLLFITDNPHKLAEARLILEPLGFRVLQLRQKPLEVQHTSVAQIAREGLRAALGRLGELKAGVMLEDAGLFIQALKGFPGPYSSYVYRTLGLEGVLRLLEGVDDRRAEFRSAVAYATPSHEVRVFTGRVQGSIANTPRGGGGFGFDPIFIPKGYDRTFAEMAPEEKGRLSHRGRALRRLATWLAKGL
jgi:XTP/dITP diphosphohydrolase